MTSALTRRGSTRRWRRIRDWVLTRDHHICQKVVDGHLCGAYATTVGHITRREHDGGDAADNLRAECEPCNYGERPPVAAATPRISLTQAGIVRLLDQVGVPTVAGRRLALAALAQLQPCARFGARDVDVACRYRRGRGPLTRA